MPTTYTPNKVLTKPANGGYVNTWDSPVNGDWDVIDAAFGGTTALSATTGSTTLSASQYQKAFLAISGTLTGNTTYVIPSGVGGQWTYDTLNLVLGAYSLTIASGGAGASVALGANVRGIIFSNGTDIKASVSVLVGGSNTQVQYNSSGALAGSANLTFDGTNLAVAGTVTGGTGAGSATVVVNGGAGSNRVVSFQSAGVQRWIVYTTSTAESGTAAGSDFAVARYNNAGVYLDSPLVINRATGVITLTQNPVVGSNTLGYLDVPFNAQSGSYTLVATDRGLAISGASGVTVPPSIFTAGNVVSIVNGAGGAITITQGSGVTMYLAGTATTGNRTLAANGLATVLCTASNTFLVTGAGVS